MAFIPSGYRDGTSRKALRHAKVREQMMAEKNALQRWADGEYAAAWVDLSRHVIGNQLEIQVGPRYLKLTFTNPMFPGRKSFIRWDGPDAAAVGRGLCEREMPLAVFADWFQEQCESVRPADQWLARMYTVVADWLRDPETTLG
jgi:hypothetical protein